MVVEQLPNVQALSPDRKLALAAEHFEMTTDNRVSEPDPENIRLLEERVREHEANPNEASPWSEVKARMLASRGK